MNTTTNVTKAEQVRALFGIQALPDELIHEALTAAGVDPNIPDGFKTLAQIGTSLIDTSIAKIGHKASKSTKTRGLISAVRADYNTVKSRAHIAQGNGIDKLIKYGTSGHGAENSLASAVSALIAVIGIGTGSLDLVLDGMLRLGFLREGKGKMLLEAYEIATAQPIEEDFQRPGYLPSAGDISPIQSNPPRKTPLPSIPSPDDRAINGVRVGTEQIVLSSTPDITVPPSLTFSDDPETWALNDLDIRSVNHSRPCSPEGEVLQATNVPVPLDLEYPLHSSYDCSLPTVPVTACLSLQDLPSRIEEHCWAGLEPSNQSEAIVQVLKEPCISQVSRKRHSSTQLSNRPEKRAATSPKIKYGGFLERESQKCEAKGHPLPCETYFQRHIEQRLLTTLRSSDPLGTILIRIADAGAFICLKNALLSSNLSSGEIVSRQTSKKDRYEIINRLDGKFALNVLLKRYHLMELFRDCGGLQSRTSTNSVFYTVESFPPKAQKKGNPNHNDDAMITERMMREVFPQLSTDNPEYERRRRAMTRLRIIGRRYQTLVNNFGQSIICLLQPCSLTGELDKGVSDNMIYDLKEADFKLLVELLEASQGKPLRDLCTKANPVVEELIYGHQTRAHRLRLQEVEIEDIVTIPKGSPDLELLLSSEDSMHEHRVIA